ENTSGIFSRVSRFIRGNFFIPDPRKGWNKYAYKKAKEIINNYHITTVITSSPPHSTQLIGLKLKQKLHLKWIADLRDPWTDIYYYKDLLRTKIAKRIDSKYEKMVLEIADRIIVVSDSIQERLKAKLDKLSVDKFTIIPNGFDEEDFLHNLAPHKEHFIITYTGTLSRIYRIDALLKALKKISRRSDIHIKLRFVGKVSDYIKSLIAEKGLDEIVKYIDHVEHAKSIEYLYHSTILLLVIPEVTENRGILTGKIFEYLASQKPILLIGPTDGDAATVVKKCEAGEVFDYDMDTEMEYYLNKLIQQWLKNPNLDLKTKRHLVYSRKKQAATLARQLLAVNSH
ncbi:MAG: glycosyltransferase, partial [Bacteroidetes bacterium]|nr:glycosyltransferase [Bacteroidota bacterium]